MATRSHGLYNNQHATNYINKKGIHELFEAIMTALMVHKPDDHIAFIRECLDKVQNHPNRLRWDHFVANTSNTKGVLPPRPGIVKSRQKPLPPVRSSNLTVKPSHTSNRQTPIKTPALPPIDNSKKHSQNPPIVLVLSSSGSTRLCSRLIERYEGINYLLINDIANIDEDDSIDLRKYEHRYDCVQHAIEQRRLNSHGFLIAGHLDEKHFYDKWQEKLGRIDLIIILSSNKQTISNQNMGIIQIDSNNDFDVILADAIRAVDEIFPHNISLNQHSQLIQSNTNNFTLPIIFCIDIHRLLIKEHNNNSNENELVENLSIDDEFDITNEGSEVESNNSFIYTLCERLAEQFSFKHIQFGDYNNILLNFDQLKTTIIESMSTCTGYIIEHFPNSFDNLQKFQTEIGPCAAFIYIGDHKTETKNGEFNSIIEKFRRENKAIFIDCRMEVDEIYEDLKKDILERI
ncbi:unnamed protein product [Rotaria sp. Silwood1]|nr:unnamed protein product [Rotaria sp. Silwood1]CAF4551010.1 unnamed protein product [Rotaria sp. Silwood1]